MQTLTSRGALLDAGGEGRVVAFRAASDAVDRHGSIIRPAGIRTERFEANPVFLWGHDGYGGPGGPPRLSSVLGRIVGFRRSAAAFDVEAEFAPAAVNPQAEQALRLVRAGFLSAVSLGFLPLDSHEESRPGGRSIVVHDAVELLEVSLVPVPSNPEALALVRAIGRAAAPAAPSPAGGAAALRAALSRAGRLRALAGVLRNAFEGVKE